MSSIELLLSFPESTSSNANVFVDELNSSIGRYIQQSGVSGEVNIAKEKGRLDTMDLGATLVLVLGTPAILAVAKGIHAYISKQQDKVVITTRNGTIVATGSAARNIDIAATVRSLEGLQNAQAV